KPASHEVVRQAFKAIRYEVFGDFAVARANWQALKEKCEKDLDQRPGFLVAARRLQELKISAPPTSKEEETKARLQRIKDALEEARRLAAEKRPQESRQAWFICMDILDLYHHYPDF